MEKCAICKKRIPIEQTRKWELAVGALHMEDGGAVEPGLQRAVNEINKRHVNDAAGSRFNPKMTAVLASAMASTVAAWKCNKCSAWICNSCLGTKGFKPVAHRGCGGWFTSPSDEGTVSGQSVGKAVGEFFCLYLKGVFLIYGLVPIGVSALIAARIVYGTWANALVFYGVHLASAASSILGLIPIYGNRLHFILAEGIFWPWALAHGVGPSWLLSVSGLLAGVLGSMCPGAMVFRIWEAKTGNVSGLILFLGAIVLIAGSVYSGILFF